MEGQYYINSEYQFSSINELIVHYMSYDLPKRAVRLTRPFQDSWIYMDMCIG